MESIPRKPLRATYQCSLALSGLTCLLGTVDARPKLLPSEHFPGPWLEVTQEIRDVLSLNKVWPAARPRDANCRATPANISCTAQRTRSFGQAGACNPRRAPFEAQAGSSKASQCRTDIKTNQVVAVSSAVCTCSALGFGAGCPLRVCAVKRRRFPVGANPTRQPLQPEASEQSWR